MARHPPLTEADRTRIREAIAAAEAKTAGEIFAVVAEESDEYRVDSPPLGDARRPPRAAAASLRCRSGELVPAAGDAWQRAVASDLFVRLPAVWIYIAQLAVFIIVALVLSIHGIRPRIVPRSIKRARAHALALDQFLAHGLHTTEERTGVLVFVSLAERYAEIVADAGIAAKVDPAIWKASMERLLADIRDGKLTDGLAGAIERAGAVLAEHFPPRPRDRNELPNELIIL